MNNDPLGLQGDNLCCLMVWIAIVLENKFKFVLHENVSAFLPDILEELMSHECPVVFCIADLDSFLSRRTLTHLDE